MIGVEIIRRLLKSPSLTSLKGTLIAVPIVNAFGFISHSRYLPDRRDLNRVFPGSATGPLASRLAHLFMTEIVLRSDLGIDLHSAAIHRINYPQVRISPELLLGFLLLTPLIVNGGKILLEKIGFGNADAVLDKFTAFVSDQEAAYYDQK